ncbi:putative ribonuclease H-like domain-containing protein [Tanacetum coccineum]
MSEAEPIPPTSSVTALRIPMIKKGEYDLWSMKMRQYIAITDHILWDIITNGDQATTDPASSSAPKTSLAANARRNNEKALNILLSAIPDRHLLSFHDATDAKTLWSAIKARFGGNEASKKMQKNPFETQIRDENRANGRQKRGMWLLKISNSKSLGATDTMKDGLGDFDWSNNADDAPVSLALMATNSEMEYDLKVRDFKLEEKQKELDQVLKERDDFKVKLEKWTNASVLQNEVLNKQRYLSDKSCIGFGVESSSSENSDNSSGNTNSTESLYPNFQKAKGFHAVPPPTEIKCKTVVNSENSETSFANSQTSVGQGSRKKGLGHKRGKTCFVCYSPDHLIKDCDLHERTFKQTQTHKPKGTQGSRDTRPVWNNINRVNHSNFSGNSRYPHQKRSFIPSAVLTREGLKSTARPKMTRTVPSKSTANVFYQGTARPRVPHAVLSQSTGRPYYPRMDNIRPRTSSFSPSTRSSTTRTPHRPQRPKKIMKFIWVKKESTVGSQTVLPKIGNPEEDLKDYAIIDSGCSGSMTGDKDKLSDFKEFKGGYVAFGNDSKGGRISGKGTIKTSCLDFEKVSYVEELKFNLLSVAPRKNDVYSLDLKNIIPSGGITCLVAKATKDEVVLWHRRLGQLNFRTLTNVQGNLKGVNTHLLDEEELKKRTIREPLELLHMDLFGPVSVESVNRKKYCLVVTDDCTKHKVIDIRCDHGTEFKNHLMNEFCAKKGIKREYSIARTPQQNGVAERKNRTLIEAARTMLADSLLPIQFWAEAVNTACYVLNRVLVTKPQMKTPYEILMGRSPKKMGGFIKEGYLLGYSTSSKGFRVYNRVTRKVQDCLHVDFLENQENQKGKGPDWMFDLELLTPSMNYIPVRKENYADSGGQETTYDDVEDLDDQQFIVHGPSINAVQNKHSEETNAFEKEKRRITLEKGKECVNSNFTLSTANAPSQITGNTPTDSDDDVPKDGVFSTNSFDDEHTDNEEDGEPDYNNMDHTN